MGRVGIAAILANFGVLVKVLHNILLVGARSSRVSWLRGEPDMPGALIVVHRHLHLDFVSAERCDEAEKQGLIWGRDVEN